MLLLLTSLLDGPLRNPEWRLAAFRVTVTAEGEGLDDPTATAAAVTAVTAFGARLFVVGETIAFGGPALVPAFDETGLSFLGRCSPARFSTADALDEIELEAEMTGLV